MGFDEPELNAEWAEDEGFQYELWTDGDDRTLATTYGAAATAAAAFPLRVTVIPDEDGTWLVNYPDVNVSTHPQKVLDDCTALFGD